MALCVPGKPGHSDPMQFGVPILALAGLVAALGFAALALFAARRHSRPEGPHPKTTSLRAADGARIPAALATMLQEHPGLNGIHTLVEPLEALAARIEFAEAAESSIDAQYYYWKIDTAGLLLLKALRAAAKRGVRVRLLLDDNGTAGLDEALAIFDSLENVEVRLFNPFPMRRARVLGYLLNFARLNRRMHNKAMIFDGALAILGGRNISDDYYSTLSGDFFMDMDIATAGPIVADVAQQFDTYWNSAPAIPARAILHPVAEARALALSDAETVILSRPEARSYHAALRETGLTERLLLGKAPLVWAKATLLFDPPEKVLGRTRARKMMWHYLRRSLGKPKQELLLISPYLVPTRAGVRVLRRFAQAGVAIHILTNSFASTDVGIVHAGYAHRRRPLLRAGIALFEYAPDATTGQTRPDLLGKRIKGTSPFSRNKLHAKVFVVDRKRVFIGSFNLDPRSFRLNTELGVVIQSEEIASALTDGFLDFVPQHAWRLSLTKAQRLRWSRADTPTLTREPHTTWAQRAFVVIASRLPIEWML